MEFKEFSLKNGLRVVFVDTKAFPTLTTLLLVGAGSRYENKKNNGIAHFLEHMFFKGSKKYPDPYTLISTIENLGGIWNAFTSKDYTGYWIKGTTDHFNIMIDVLSDVLLNPLLKEEEIEKEKGVIVEEINMYEDTPQNKVGDLFENLLYQGSSLGFDIIGSKNTVVKFNQKTFIDYRRLLYHPKNAVLVVAGGINQTQNSKPKTQNHLDLIKEKFQNWEDGKKAEVKKVSENQKKPQILVRHKKTEQAHFCLGYRTFSFSDSRRYALSVLAAILGVGASSKLFMELREKRGLCYYVSTSLSAYEDCGNIVTQAGVPVSADKIKEAVKATIAEHEKIAQGNFSQKDLQKAKEIIKGRLLLSMEDSFNIAHFFGKKLLLEGKLESPQQVIEKIEKVTKEEVKKVAKAVICPAKLNLAVIGPIERKSLVLF